MPRRKVATEQLCQLYLLMENFDELITFVKLEILPRLSSRTLCRYVSYAFKMKCNRTEGLEFWRVVEKRPADTFYAELLTDAFKSIDFGEGTRHRK